MIRARAEKMLPMLMPALAAVLRGREGDDWDGICGGVALVVVVEGDGGDGIDGVTLIGVVEGGFWGEASIEDDARTCEDVGENEVDDVSAVMVEDEVLALGVASPPSEVRAERPHVCGSTASSDVRSKVGVLAKSSSSKFSSCMWQIPSSSYSL